MRKIISLSITALLILTVIAVGTWATAPTGAADQTAVFGVSGVRINPFEMMTNAKDLPVQQYDTH
jgi:predicted secreted Zn-dependent protease